MSSEELDWEAVGLSAGKAWADRLADEKRQAREDFVNGFRRSFVEALGREATSEEEEAAWQEAWGVEN